MARDLSKATILTHRRFQKESNDGSALKRPDNWLEKMKSLNAGFVPNPDKIAGIIDAAKGLKGAAAGTLLINDPSSNTLRGTLSKTTLKSRHNSVAPGGQSQASLFNLTAAQTEEN